jgi:hypothetical protein
MKLLVLGLDGASPERLFGDEHLTSLRRLMEWGCYGRLECVTPSAAAEVSAEITKVLGEQCVGLERLTVSDYGRDLDEQIGELLEGLSEDAAVLVVSDHGAQPLGGGCFILAAPNNPLSGEVEGAHLLDLAPTLLEIGGYHIPASIRGRSLVAGKPLGAPARATYSADEEAIIRERLVGLGYIE